MCFLIGMRYLGELTKLCAYGFIFMFQVFPVPRRRARDNCIAHTTWFPLLKYTLIDMMFDTLIFIWVVWIMFWNTLFSKLKIKFLDCIF